MICTLTIANLICDEPSNHSSTSSACTITMVTAAQIDHVLVIVKIDNLGQISANMMSCTLSN